MGLYNKYISEDKNDPGACHFFLEISNYSYGSSHLWKRFGQMFSNVILYIVSVISKLFLLCENAFSVLKKKLHLTLNLQSPLFKISYGNKIE